MIVDKMKQQLQRANFRFNMEPFQETMNERMNGPTIIKTELPEGIKRRQMNTIMEAKLREAGVVRYHGADKQKAA